MSAGSGHLAVVRVLLDNGADSGAVDKQGLTPATCANLFYHKDVEQCLQLKRY